jgi:hypothetical protein
MIAEISPWILWPASVVGALFGMFFVAAILRQFR